MTMHVANAQVSEAFEEMMGLHTDRQMRVEPKLWGELGWGMYLVDTKGKCWQVAGGPVNGWYRLRDIHGEEVSVPPRPADYAVNVVVLPEAEAVLLLEKALGGRVIADNYTQARQLLVADRWAVDMMPTTGAPKSSAMRKLRDHMGWFHSSQWTNDVKTVEELAQVHEEMHASIADMPMSRPHHHRPNPGGSR